MAKKKKGPERMPVQVAKGIAVDCLCLLALVALGAALVRGGVVGQGSIGTLALVCSAAAVFLGSLIIAARSRQKCLPTAMAACGGYLLVLLMGNLLFVRATPSGFAMVVVPGVLMAGLAAIVASRPRKKRYKSK